MNIELPKKCEVLDSMLEHTDHYVAIYARESKDDINILNNQVSSCKNYAREKRFLVYDVYKELTSAARNYYFERTEFMRLIEDAKKGYFSKIIVTKRDRIARNYDDYIQVKNLLKQLKIEVIYANDIQLENVNNYASSFIENMIMAMAQYEPSNINKRTQDGINTKREEGIYDRKESYGYVKKRGIEYDSYIKDGVRADLVEDIFRIYLNYPEVTTARDIIERLNEYKFTNRQYDEKQKEEYKREVFNKVDEGFVRDVISKPIYAAQQTKNLAYKYKRFIMTYNGVVTAIDLDYFSECKNVNKIIQDNEWMESVTKWMRHNSIAVEKKQWKKFQKSVFTNKLYCKKCKKDIVIDKNNVTCKTKNCFSVRKDKFFKEFSKQLINCLKVHGVFNKVSDQIISKLKSYNHRLGCELKGVISRQEFFIRDFLNNSSNEDLIRKIKELNDEQESLKIEIQLIKYKIKFLEEKLDGVIIPLVELDYFDIVFSEIIENQKELLEVFVQNHIKELIINGKSICIKG